MGSNWHVKREQPTIAELTTRVAKLDAAKAEDARRKALDGLSAKEIVDRIMER